MSSLAAEAGQSVFSHEAKHGEEEKTEKLGVASADVLASRTILTAKRKNTGAAGAAVPKPSFNFGVPSTTTTTAQEEKKEEKNDNPFAAGFAKKDQWQCKTCAVNNDNHLEKCRGCDFPKGGAATNGNSTENGAHKSPSHSPAHSPKKVPLSENPFAAGFAQPGKWKCDVCGVSSDKDDAKCRGCDKANPSHKPSNGAEKEEEKKEEKKEEAKEEKAVGSTFGFNSSSSSGLFSFSNPSSSTPGTGFSFSASTLPSFSFDTSGFSGFSGGGGAFSGFNTTTTFAGFGTSDKQKEENGDGEGSKLGGNSSHSDSAEMFNDAKPVETGDSSDTVEFSIKDVKVFQLMPVTRTTNDADGKEKVETKIDWVDSGKGEVNVNTYTGTNGKILARIICRRERTLNLLVNAPLFSGMKVDLMNAKNMRLITFGRVEKEDGTVSENEPITYLLKATGRGETAQGMFDAVNKVIKQVEESAAATA